MKKEEERMEELDDMIQRSFANDDPAARFPFKEAYWEQALALIEADEKRKKRRRLLWWWFAPLSLIALIAAAWWQSGGQVASANHINGAKTGVMPSAEAMKPIAPTAADPISNDAQAPATAPTETRQFAGETRQNTEPVSPVPAPRSQPDFSPKNQPDIPVSTRAPLPSDTRSPRENQNKQTINARPMAQTSGAAPSTKNDERHAPATTVYPAVAHTTLSPIHENNPPVAASSTAVANPPQTPVETPAAPAVKIDALLALPYADMAIGRPKPTVLPINPAPMPPKTSPTDVFDPPSPWSFGALIGTTAPVLDHSWGAQAGLSTGYRLRRHWSLQADLKMRMTRTSYLPDSTGNNYAEADLTETRFSFGYEIREVLPTQLTSCWLDVPLSLRYNRKYWSAEAGLGASYRLLTLRREEIARSESLAPEREIVDVRYRRFAADSPSWQFQALAGAYWTPAPRWQIGARLYRTLNPASVFNAGTETASPDWRSELLLRFRLF